MDGKLISPVARPPGTRVLEAARLRLAGSIKEQNRITANRRTLNGCDLHGGDYANLMAHKPSGFAGGR